MDFYCRNNEENERYSEFYAESHFVLPFSRKNLPKKVIKLFIFFDVGQASAESSGTAMPFYQNKTNISN